MRAIEPIVYEGFGDRHEDSQRIGPVPSLEKRHGLFDEPLQFLGVARRPIIIQ
jgi:hypothetical protein